MTTIDHVEHGLGILSLVTMAGLSARVFHDAFGMRHRILAALRGEHLSPAASVAPLATAPSPQLRVVEADVEPALITPTKRGFAPARGRDHG